MMVISPARAKLEPLTLEPEVASSSSTAPAGPVGGGQVYAVDLEPGMAVLDTGCRTAVGGPKWHRELQKKSDERGCPYHCEAEKELFQFGPGDPIMSDRRWTYKAGIHGMENALQCSEVPADRPGPIGPDEMTSWGLAMDVRVGR